MCTLYQDGTHRLDTDYSCVYHSSWKENLSNDKHGIDNSFTSKKDGLF